MAKHLPTLWLRSTLRALLLAACWWLGPLAAPCFALTLHPTGAPSNSF